ncbi:uncharacterized protein LOC113278170 [Papaver somniferum]|uniref:uncharacterized protein LOC113278170 n=1 Tax=Papaver somniferum TaxID=3469 RepID=UPI000E6FE6E0|nr:uncharacterized protein LOC113278170 [Papaver somniferum]
MDDISSTPSAAASTFTTYLDQHNDFSSHYFDFFFLRYFIRGIGGHSGGVSIYLVRPSVLSEAIFGGGWSHTTQSILLMLKHPLIAFTVWIRKWWKPILVILSVVVLYLVSPPSHSSLLLSFSF